MIIDLLVGIVVVGPLLVTTLCGLLLVLVPTTTIPIGEKLFNFIKLLGFIGFQGLLFIYGEYILGQPLAHLSDTILKVSLTISLILITGNLIRIIFRLNPKGYPPQKFYPHTLTLGGFYVMSVAFTIIRIIQSQ